MANTGFITSSGIQQVFTSGPFLGSVVSSSYISGGIVFGPTTNFNQSFISGTFDTLAPCTSTFQRYYQDLIACPINGCTPPTLFETLAQCSPYNYEYLVLYNSGSTDALFTVIEYSTSNSFTNTGSKIQDNSLPWSNLIDVSDLLYLPTAYTNIYFRAYNSCSIGTKSAYSNTNSASCNIPSIPPSSLTFNSISSTQEDPQWQIYTINGEPGTRIDYSTSNLFNGNAGGLAYMVNLADNTHKNLSFKTPSSGYYIIPISGQIILQIYYSASPSLHGGVNCVYMDITFLDLIESGDPLGPNGIINLDVCSD